MHESTEISYNCIALHLISVDDDNDDIALLIYVHLAHSVCVCVSLFLQAKFMYHPVN